MHRNPPKSNAAKLRALLDILRGAHPLIEHVFTLGACFELYRAVAVFIPEVQPYYDHNGGHVYLELGGLFYDINGVCRSVNKSKLVPMREDRKLMRGACKWHRQDAKRKKSEMNAAMRALIAHYPTLTAASLEMRPIRQVEDLDGGYVYLRRNVRTRTQEIEAGALAIASTVPRSPVKTFTTELCPCCGVHVVWTSKEPLKQLLEETVRYVGHEPKKEQPS